MVLNDKINQNRIKTEITRLSKLLNKIDPTKLKIVKGLIERAAFMKVALEELERTVREEGVLDLFEQGDYTYNREHPALKSFNTTIKNYTNVCKQLTDLLPKEIPKHDDDDGFSNFVNDRDD